MDNILKRSVELDVRNEIINNKALVASFKDPQELDNYIKNQIDIRMKATAIVDGAALAWNFILLRD